MCWFAAASGKSGRSPKFLDSEIQFLLIAQEFVWLSLLPNDGTIAVDAAIVGPLLACP